ncbi:MAG: VRR-NUC domain-containing protein [Ruminococcus sp.]
MTEEHRIQNEIRVALSENCIIFRGNVGKGYTKDGRYFDTGLPAGFSDLFGVRKSDGKAVFIEVKTKKGRVTAKQNQFIKAMQNAGAIAGVCRSVQEAKSLVASEIGVYDYD